MLKIDDNRWRGLAPYPLHEDKEGRLFYKEGIQYFYGRKKEIEELKIAIRDNSFTTIYGVSGAGKTSLINAGVIPELKNENYLTVPVRLDHRTSIGYNTQIINAIKEEVKIVGGEVESWSKFAQDDLEEDERLWHFLFSSRIWSKTNYQLIPVIFIDQFEEIFTMNEESERIVHFFETINSLQYNMPSEHILSLLEQENRYVDFNDVAQFRMVFIMREDFLARLEDYSVNIPALRRNRRGIKRMNGHQALDVIEKPYPGIVNREVAIQILGKVVGKEISDKEYTLDRLSVDTSILSLFCSKLYRKAAESQAEVITEELVGQFGDDIITSFYEDTMKRVPKKTREYLEAHLLTYSGFRNAMALEDMLRKGIKDEELKVLEEERLIRKEERDGTVRVEFMHDVLCKVAKDHRDGKKTEQDIEKKLNSENRIKFQFFSSTLVGLVVLFICLTINERFNSFGLRPFLFVMFLSISLFGIYKLLFEMKMCNRLSLRYIVSGIIAYIIIMIGGAFDVPIDFAMPSQSSFIGLMLYFFPFYICLFVSYLLEECNKTSNIFIDIFKSMAFILLIIPLFCFQIQKYAMAIIMFLFALFVLNPYRFTKEKNVWWITALEGLMISISIVFIVVNKKNIVSDLRPDYLNSIKTIFIITSVILFLTVIMTVISNLSYNNNKERSPKEAWNYCLSFGPYLERYFFKKTFAVILLLFAIIGSIVFGEKYSKYAMIGILFFAPISCVTIKYLFFGTIKLYHKITYSHIICVLCLIVISASLCSVSQNTNNWLIWVAVVAWVCSLYYMLKDAQTQENSKYEKLPIVVMWFVAFLCIPVLCSYGIEDILIEFLKYYEPPIQQSFSNGL